MTRHKRTLIPMRTALTESPWIVRFRPGNCVTLRLICFTYAGGTAMAYRRWPDALPAEIDICAVELPGHGSRTGETPIRRMSYLLPVLLAELLPYVLDVPFALFGHSLGALVAFELARELKRKELPSPANVFVSGRRAPPTQEAEAIHQLPDADFVQRVKELNGTPTAVFECAELLQIVLPRLRADFELSETHVHLPGTVLTCPITVFGGSRDEQSPLEELALWRDQTRGPFSMCIFPGDHFFLHSCETSVLHEVRRQLLLDR